VFVNRGSEIGFNGSELTEQVLESSVLNSKRLLRRGKSLDKLRNDSILFKIVKIPLKVIKSLLIRKSPS